MKLTPKQRLFVREYLVDLNATRAAKSAGYSEKTAYSQGARLLKHVEVGSEIERLKLERANKLDISAEYVLSTIHRTVERCSQSVEVLDREGNPTGEWKEDSFAVLKGCELLGRHLKLFTDRIEQSGHIELTHFDPTEVSDEQLRAWEESLAPLGAARGDS